MFKIVKIREKVLIAVISVSMISLLSIAVTSYINIMRITDYSETVNRELAEDAINGTDGALYDQAYDFLSVIAEEQRKMADVVLENIALNVSLIEGAVRDIYKNPQYYNGHEISRPGDAVVGVYESTWLLAERYELTDEIKREINLLSNLDMIMPTLSGDPNIIELYVGTVNGLLYNYTQMTFENPTYDPRERPWYIDALQNPDKVIFTDVYEDAFGTGMVLTAAKTIFGEDGGLIGVAALDIQLDALKSLVLSTRVAETGYVFIMDKNGVYIVHPDMGNESFANFQDDNNVPFADGLRCMMNGEQGFIREEVDGGGVYLAFAPLSTADWSVGVVVPENEILSAKETLSVQMRDITEKASEDMDAMSAQVVWIFIVVSALCVLIIFVIGMYLTSIISKPIAYLTEGVSLFGKGALESRAYIKTQDEIGALADMFNQMADNIVKNMEELASTTAERERVNSELRIAAMIQKDMLPDVSAKFSGHPAASVYALVEPALEMGGDLYDVFFIDKQQRKLCTVVADVSGKGMPAAMFMVMAKTLIRNYIYGGETPADALRKANNRLCEDNPSSMFVTAYISLADLDTGECSYSQAGHNPIVYCPCSGEFRFVITDKTMPLGFFEGSKYPLYHFHFMPGDKFFYYTDGVTEALNENDVEWGEDALLETLNGSRLCSCDDIANRVREGITKHAGQAEQSDDITILVMEYLGTTERNRVMTVKNSLESLDAIYNEIASLSNEYGFSQEIQNELCLCMDEVFSNIVQYAYDDNGEHDIEVRFKFDKDAKRLTITIMDDGKAFNPLEAKSPDLSLDLMEREIGGLGIFIVSNIMSSVEYNRLDGRNKLEMIKNVE